jgi:hypothetical protein
MDRDKLTEKLESLPLKDFSAPVHQARLKNALLAAGAKVKKPARSNIREKLTGFFLSLGGAFSSKKPVWQAALAGLLLLAIMVIVALSVPGVLRTPNPPAAPVTVTLPAMTSYSTATATITVPAGGSVVTVTKTVAGPGGSPTVTVTSPGASVTKPPITTAPQTTLPATTLPPVTFPTFSIPPQITPTVNVTVNVPQATLTVPLPTFTVVVPTLTIPQITIPTPTFNLPQVTVVIPTQPVQATPAYIWVIVAVGAILTIAVIVLIIRTRRVV